MENSTAASSNAYMIYTPIAVFVILCPLMVCNRMWCHWKNRGKLGLDDFVILTSLVRIPRTCYILCTPCTLHVLFLSSCYLKTF